MCLRAYLKAALDALFFHQPHLGDLAAGAGPALSRLLIFLHPTWNLMKPNFLPFHEDYLLNQGVLQFSSQRLEIQI